MVGASPQEKLEALYYARNRGVWVSIEKREDAPDFFPEDLHVRVAENFFRGYGRKPVWFLEIPVQNIEEMQELVQLFPVPATAALVVKVGGTVTIARRLDEYAFAINESLVHCNAEQSDPATYLAELLEMARMRSNWSVIGDKYWGGMPAQTEELYDGELGVEPPDAFGNAHSVRLTLPPLALLEPAHPNADIVLGRYRCLSPLDYWVFVVQALRLLAQPNAEELLFFPLGAGPLPTLATVKDSAQWFDNLPFKSGPDMITIQERFLDNPNNDPALLSILQILVVWQTQQANLKLGEIPYSHIVPGMLRAWLTPLLLPEGQSTESQATQQYRTDLEAALLDQNGPTGLTPASESSRDGLRLFAERAIPQLMQALRRWSQSHPQTIP